jgi:lysozyme
LPRLGGSVRADHRPDRGRFRSAASTSAPSGEIDWARVAGDDVEFAYIKASEGGDRRDEFREEPDGR